MLVGGVPVDERLLRRLAEVVPPAVGPSPGPGVVLPRGGPRLTAAERRAILAALENPPPGLENLRATLIQDPAWRQPEARSSHDA